MRSTHLAATQILAMLLSACLPLASPPPATSPLMTQDSAQHLLYTDDQVASFLERYPALASPPFQENPPEDVLERLQIDLTQLTVLDIYIGDCPTLTVYDLSPSYKLVVDHNACYGLLIRIRPK